MKRKWKQVLGLLLAITILFTSGIIPELSVRVQAENSISKTEGSNYPYYCETCGFYYAVKESHKQRISCTGCNNTGKTLCTLCNATGKLYCGQDGTYTETITKGQEIASGMMDSATHVPIGTKIPFYHNWKCNICQMTGTWTYWTYYNVPGISGDDEGVRPTDISAHTYSNMSCTQCNGTGQYGGTCTDCNGLGSKEDSSFCISKWKYRVVFDENGGSCDTKSGYYTGGCSLPSASKKGYRFLGWNTEPSSTTGNGSVFITAPINYYAIFEKLGTATFIDMEGTRDITANSLLNEIYAPSIRAGDYEAIGWSEEIEPDSNIVKKFQDGKTYYARYQTYATIEYHMGKDEKGKDYAGSSEKPQGDNGNIIVNANAYNIEEWKGSSTLPMAQAPEWQGHKFLGWSDGNEIYAPGDYPKLQKVFTVFTALWKLKSNKILLDSNGATSNGDTFVEVIMEEDMPNITPPKKEYIINFHKNAEDNNIVIDDNLLKNSYLFQGYYTSSNGTGIKYYNEDGTSAKKWDKTEDTTLYASWINKGITLPTASRKGYLFKGWSTSSNAIDGIKAGTNYKTEKDTDLYAIWKRETYSIQYNLTNGSLLTENPDSYHVDTETFTLKNPIRDGYTFLGWTEGKETVPEKNVQIEKGSVGNKSYTAHWKAKADTIYKVEIYQMDLNGNYPVLPNEIKKLTGTTDTNVIAASIAENYIYSGFTYKNAKVGSMVVSEMKIAGEGNAILKLFYERNKYTFTLGTCNHVKTAGTTTIGSYYYGAMVTLKAQPNLGYHWVKWQSSDTSKIADNTNQNIVITMPVGDFTMTPIVEADADTPYQIIIHKETLNRDDFDSSADIIIKKKGISDTKINAEDIAKVYTYEGFSYSYAKIQDSITENKKGFQMNIDGDGTSRLHLYYVRNQYQLIIGDYDKNQLTTNNTNQLLLYGEKIKLKALSLPGYKFSHWDSGNTKIQPDLKTATATMTMAASDISMTPIAEEITYTVEFKANDTNSHTPENNVRATNIPNAQEYDYNEEFSMPVCVREGFRFLGWSTSKNGSVVWSAGTKVSGLSTIDKAVVKLYAQWEENKYSIQFHANDGKATAHNPLKNVQATGSMDIIKSYYYTDNILLPNNGFARTGFTFMGWSLVEDSNIVEYKSGDFIHNLSSIHNSVITLYAAWRENSYSIIFKPGDFYCYGTEQGISAKVSNPQAMNTVRVYYTDGFTMPDCSYIREGFHFVGWSKDKKASEKTYTNASYQGELYAGDSILNLDLAKEHIYYPVWKENQYKIIYHSNDNKNLSKIEKIESKNIYYTEKFRLAKNGFRRTGFTLCGWSIEEGSNTVSYAKEEKVLKFTVNEVINLYAAWKENSYQISFQPNDDYCYGTKDGITIKVSNPYIMDSLELTYSENALFPECDYIREGFTFLGWSRNKEDSLKTYEENINAIKPGTPISFLSSDNDDKLIYYPVWKENQYSIHFDKNDENNAAEPANESKAEEVIADIENIYYTQEVNLKRNKFTRIGFDYKGWSDKEKGTVVIWKDGEKCQKLSKIDGDIVTLYAVWSLRAPEITEQTKETDLGKEVKPKIPITISVSAIGFDIDYQWYYMDKMQTSKTAIKGANDRIYTIPAEEIIEKNDGRTYYCIIKNKSGEVKSEPITIYVYGTPSIPIISNTDANEYGWNNKDVCITPLGSTIKGNKKQVGYLYSFDKITWLEYKELIWKENTLPEGKNLYFCAYNKECTELKSPIITYTIRKDNESPQVIKIAGSRDFIVTKSAIITKNAVITEDITSSSIITLPRISEIITESAVIETEEDINNRTQVLKQENYPIIIYAKDYFSGIFGYAIAKKGQNEKKWQKNNTFEISTGTYNAYIMDMAGNITKQEFIVYMGGYVLLPESSGSYIDNNIAYVIGEGIAKWDNHMDIDKSKITHIIIQDGITEIPDGFFEGFVNLKEVTIPNSVIKIGEHAFYGVPKDMVIHAPEGSKAAKEAERLHNTRYIIKIESLNMEIQGHYYDKIKLPQTAPKKDGYLFIGWGTKPEEKEFEPGEMVSGLSQKPDGVVILYPIYKEYKEEQKEDIKEKNPSVNDNILIDSNKVPINSNQISDNTEINMDKDHQQKEEQEMDSWKETDPTEVSEEDKEKKKGYYKINENNYDSLEDIFDQDQEMDSNGKKTIYANGENIISDDLKIPEDVVILVNGRLVIEGDLTLLGELIIEKNSEVIIEGNIIAEETSQFSIHGKLKVNGSLLTNGYLYIGETGILDISTNANCEILSKGVFENNGTILGTIKNPSMKKDMITVKTKFSSLIIKKDRQYKITPLKGDVKWKIKNKKIASIKKKKGNLILTGKKKGKTILIGETKKHTYQYIIIVKKSNNNQVKLITTEKKKSRRWILTKKGIIIRKTFINNTEGKIELKLLKAGKNVKWKFSEKELLKENGNRINVVINAGVKYILKAKYKGKIYQCSLYRA